ncbi:MAG: polyprenyl synthetase family protein [Flavobacteriia bacterium]|nr:polyprenyl synthetase family protein [Flavobacteriia bacterium]
MTSEEIMQPVREDLKEFETYLGQTMKSEIPLLDKVTHYLVKRKGKQVRPIFVFLSCRLFQPVNQKALDAAALVELLHTATLVHDDVVDDANERRGYFSVNALWKNKIAVLVGDYMLSRILLLSLEKNNTDLLEIIARSVREMSEGELLQIEKARKLDITEEVYFEVIRKKTASLISTCCEAGCLASGEVEHRERLRKFGELVGLAFQIKDDIFDYGSSSEIGKPTGNDIREQKLTLPMIYTLDHASTTEQRELRYIIKNRYNEEKYIRRAMELVIQNGGLTYAQQRMVSLGEEAKKMLEPLENNEAKTALIGLVDYTMQRTK